MMLRLAARSVALLLLFPLMTCAVPPPTPSTAIAGRARRHHVHSFEVALPQSAAFPLFEPVGEKNWAPGWQPVFVTEGDARLHVGSVFTVARPRAGGGPPVESVWTLTRYDPPRRIEYFSVLTGVRATRIRVDCEPSCPASTRVTVRYDYSGLSDEGDRAIEGITEAAYRGMIDAWGREIAAWIVRGTPASP